MSKKSFISAINEKTSISEKGGGIGSVFKSTEKEVRVAKSFDDTILNADPNDPIELRQSFIIMSDDFDKLKDYVYHKKKEDPSFSQKEALHLALQLLFEQEQNIPARPAKVRQQEVNRSKSLSKYKTNK